MNALGSPIASQFGAEICEILLVEDNISDARLILMALEEGRKVHVCHVDNGGDAVEILYKRGEHANAPRPDLIILDLNLPKLSGHEVLEQIKQEPSLLTIPVVVFTTSSAKNDISRCYRRGANAYMVKPSSLDDLFNTVWLFRDYWLNTVLLPRSADA